MLPSNLHGKIPAAGLAVALAAMPLAGAAEIPPAQLKFFENRIRPVLLDHCYECHAADAKKIKGDLVVDSRAGILEGGDSGPALIAGKPGESLLYLGLTHDDPDFEMPPKEKLPPRVIADFKKWITMGAPDPRDGPKISTPSKKGIDIETGRRFWSFQPIQNPPIPKTANTDWPLDPVDRFLLARLDDEHLQPAPDAPRSTLIRRLTIDLTGLPPTVTEQDAFLADRSPQAIEKVVDRLLASDAFGERWGRHWLDIARYADSSGGGRALPFPDAWRFRDYVIRSFREDRPLDQLIREHIAGDLMAHPDEDVWVDQLIATGFLVLGPINYENQDKDLLDLDIVDEQIDTLGRAFLGMTIGCARCHDHKFDPIPTRDYYALAGIFKSSNFVEHANVSTWFTQPLPPTREQAAAIARYEKESTAIKAEITRTKKDLAALGFGSGGSGKSVAAASLAGVVVDNAQAERIGEWEDSVHTARWVGAGYIHDLKQDKGEKSVIFRPAIPETTNYEVRVSYNGAASRSAKVPVTIRHAYGEKTVFLNQKLKPEIDGLFQSLGSYKFNVGNTGSVEISNRGTEDGFVIIDAVQFVKPNSKAAPDAVDDSPLPPEVKTLRDQLTKLEARLKKHKTASPKLPVAMCVGEKEDHEIGDIPIRVRGEIRNFGEIAPRGFLRVAQAPEAPAAPALVGSGRLELANWVASPDNPLTARVLANRIWLHLFGEGIVRTPDNFGTTGDAPTHPALLDHLARRLIESGWSTKSLVRDLVLSRAYRMASTSTDKHGSVIDPENRLLWRMHRRRLDAETMRDSILLVSGELDLDAGGPSLPPKFKSEFGFEFTTRKRSVYVPVFRNELYEVFSTFGFANPNFVVGRRAQSTIPTQSLFLMNSPFIHEEARAAADSLLTHDASTDRDRLRLAYRRILCREPSPAEEKLSLNFLASLSSTPEDAPAPPEAWAALIRSLFSSLDFQYIL